MDILYNKKNVLQFLLLAAHNHTKFYLYPDMPSFFLSNTIGTVYMQHHV